MEMTLVETNFALQRFKGDQEKFKVQIAQLEKDLEAIQATSAKLSQTLEGLQGALAEAKKKVVEKQKLAGTTGNDLETQLATLKGEHTILQRERSAYPPFSG